MITTAVHWASISTRPGSAEADRQILTCRLILAGDKRVTGRLVALGDLRRNKSGQCLEIAALQRMKYNGIQNLVFHDATRSCSMNEKHPE
ncbi:hypothetical protein GZH49_12665 [Nocardia terpenica]|uniref:hypothetical protein n=1 Tax=Nocardia terpenica TaxID=455432 RepID=UPI002FE18E1B